MQVERPETPQGIFKFLAWISRILIPVTAVCLLLMMVILSANVIGRFLFNKPFPSTIDSVGLLGALLISLALGPSEIARRNVNIPIVTDTLPQGTRKVFDVITMFLCLIIVAVFAWTGAHQAWVMWVKNEMMPVLEWPVAPFRWIWVLGCLLLFIALAAHLVERLRKRGA
jgi:TRAP-type C4-dicarboxylate transport system permease small subunit